MQPLRILFIPEEASAETSDRTPALLRLLRQHHTVVGLPALWERSIYDPRRAKAPRYALYVVERSLAALRGLRAARRAAVQIVFAETPHHALVGLWIARILGVPCVWDSHGNALLFAQSVGKGRAYTLLSSALDRYLGRRVDALITVSERDAEAYAAMGVPRAALHVVPTSVDVGRIDAEGRRAGTSRVETEGVEGRRSLLFFGSFQYAPNLAALRFISGRLAPFLEKEEIACDIRIAGRDVPGEDLHPSVRSLGFVPDIHDCIRHADLCVVPVFQGVGILTKVVDIMAVGTPVVVSGFALHGIPEIRDGVHAVVAATEDAFPERVAFALGHPDRMAEMAREARRLVEARYDWKVYEPVLGGLLASLASRAGSE